MGEYATRISDGERIKIGTCEDMFYLRFEDRYLVSPLPGNVNPARDVEAAQIRFRLPFADEDDIRPGDYKDPFRALRLYRGNEDFTDESTANHPGTIQLQHACGLLVNVPCYHGHKLPTLGDARVFWNGKSWSLELFQLRPDFVDGELRVFPVVRCRHCQHVWRYEWPNVWEFIPPEMRTRLRGYKEQFERAA
jgi:hypothetical protein